MGSQLVETPAEMMAKATRMLRRVMFLQMVWFPALWQAACCSCGRPGRTTTFLLSAAAGQGRPSPRRGPWRLPPSAVSFTPTSWPWS